MAITVDEDDIRSALDADASEYPDPDLAFEKSLAESIVNDDLEPHTDTDRSDRLKLVGALIAAAYVDDDGDVTQLQQGDRSVSFDSDSALSHWRKALQLDPTGRLSQLEQQTIRFGTPNVRGCD
ncbi:hypothetical protein ACFPYI_01915 [Halomarina salina]|uniref:Uncharacterized protein n=1 Tax=Halomarina salina TaxID=1872699 RepID=A0ABD5RHM3_9EURY|nr:hypothetical protein [Halomarina salina]